MNRKTAAPVILTVSLVVLMSGGAGAAAHGGPVQDDLRPAANAAILGLARGHVIVRDDLSPTRGLGTFTVESIVEAVQPDAARAWSAEARREFHAQAPVSADIATEWTAEARREFHAQLPVSANTATAWTAEARREFHAQLPDERAFSPAEIRELKGSAPVDVRDDLSPLRDGRSTLAPQHDEVDDDQSPLRGDR
jgi:hypothetical protein